MMNKPEYALGQLKNGNQRFLNARSEILPTLRANVIKELADEQNPLAVILGCSDSRVPPEIVFDQGLGTLFVVRVAGNLADRTQIGSIEFAVQEFNCPLVVVLGHSQCGAIKAAFNQLKNPVNVSKSVSFLLESIRPTVEKLQSSFNGINDEGAIADAVRLNVQSSVDRLLVNSPILATKCETGELKVVGAEYLLESGAVEFLED